MIVIFMFSAQPAVTSAELSGSLTRELVGTILRWFAPAEYEVPESLIDTFETLLRKCAHLFIFLVMGICTSSTIQQITEHKLHVFLVSLCWSSLYAAIDEIHQLFVSGRAGQLQDWLIDTTGALLGIAIVLCIAWHIKRKRICRKNKYLKT